MRRAGSAVRPTAYVALATTVIALLTAQTFNEQWSSDHWVHQATLVAVAADPFDPEHPLVGGAVDSEYVTPFTVVLGLLTRLLDLDPVLSLQLAAVVNLVLLLIAFRLFVHDLVDDRRVAPWALVATLVCWGLRPWRWSGFLNLNSIGFGLHYPAVLATAGALYSGHLLLRWSEDRELWRLAALAPILALVVLIHPFTGMWSAAMLIALALARRCVGLPLLAAVAVAIVFVVGWPYYEALELLRAGGTFNSPHDRLYEAVPMRLVAAAPGLVALAARVRRDRADPLALMFVFGVVMYGAGAVLDEPNLDRSIPLLVLPLHIGIGLLIVQAWDRRRSPRGLSWRLALPAAAVGVGLVGVAPGLARMVPRDLMPDSLRERTPPFATPYAGLADALPYGTIVLAETTELRRIAAGHGGKTFLPGYPSAFVDDLPQRAMLTSRLLAGEGAATERTQIALSRGVGAVLCESPTCVSSFEGRDVSITPEVTLVQLVDPP